MFAVIYGRPGCSFCTRAKKHAETLKTKRDDFNYRYIDMYDEGLTKADIEKAIGKPVATVPQILIDQQYIGGCTEFEAYAATNLGLFD